MSFRIRSAADEELADLLKLLDRSQLPGAGVEEHFSNYLVAEEEKRIVGMVGLELYGSVGLVRSLAVAPYVRSKGIGSALVHAILEKAKERGLEEVYLLTTTADGYFPRFGFEPIPRDQIDSRLHSSKELQGVCPQSAVCMKLTRKRPRGS
jgi:amino-acid N-acetyltransferase